MTQPVRVRRMSDKYGFQGGAFAGYCARCNKALTKYDHSREDAFRLALAALESHTCSAPAPRPKNKRTAGYGRRCCGCNTSWSTGWYFYGGRDRKTNAVACSTCGPACFQGMEEGLAVSQPSLLESEPSA